MHPILPRLLWPRTVSCNKALGLRQVLSFMEFNNDLARIATNNFSNSKLDIQIVKNPLNSKTVQLIMGWFQTHLEAFLKLSCWLFLVLGILCLSTTCSTTIYSSHRWVQNKKILEEKPSSSFSMRHFDSWEVWVVSKSRFESLSFSPSLSLSHTHTHARAHTHAHPRLLTCMHGHLHFQSHALTNNTL